MNNKNELIQMPFSPNSFSRFYEDSKHHLPEILFITTYPPRECGIATYSQDLIKSLNNKFNNSFTIKICALESATEQHEYTEEIAYKLNTDYPEEFISLAKKINLSGSIKIVVLQHEFGFFDKREDDLLNFLKLLITPIVIVFHTVLPHPQESLKIHVQQIVEGCESVIVMTQSSAKILMSDYLISQEKINVIAHGTHLVKHSDKDVLKEKYSLTGNKILSTFGLLSSGKSIETTLNALPDIIKICPDIKFLIIGKTHPSVVKAEGEIYRNMLKGKIAELKLEEHVLFINQFLPLPELLEYLQLTDIYLFTSKDPAQAVSGTFSYAISCGCPVISTPIPHAKEVLRNNAGIIIDFGNSQQLSKAVIGLLANDTLRKKISSNGLHKMASTAWENSAISHAMMFEKITSPISLDYNSPAINLDHIKNMTTDFGIIQFSKINQPDIDSGYTVDDNARALIAMCQYIELTGNKTAIKYIAIYFNFIKYCLQPDDNFLNYVDEQKHFTEQNYSVNLADANGRAIWALGYLISLDGLLPEEIIMDAEIILKRSLANSESMYSSRAMAFVIKGLYYAQAKNYSEVYTSLIKKFANRLVQMYRHEASSKWLWFESYLTYANSVLPEAMLCAWSATGISLYKEIAKTSFDFLLSKTFTETSIKVISNKKWLYKDAEQVVKAPGGEQPIDVAYTILALHRFADVFNHKGYHAKIKMAFDWFLGNNHLKQIIYNPCTGGCYDGLEENYVNLNQGAESTVSYLMARLAIERPFFIEQEIAHENLYSRVEIDLH